MSSVREKVRTMGTLAERLNESGRRIGKMCRERRPPAMSIPVNPRDDDVFITTTLADAAARVAELEADRPCYCCREMADEEGCGDGCACKSALLAGTESEPCGEQMANHTGLYVCRRDKHAPDTAHHFKAVENDGSAPVPNPSLSGKTSLRVEAR